MQINNSKDFWKKVLALIQLEVTPLVYGANFSKTTVGEINQNVIEVFCDSEHSRLSIEKKYSQIVGEAIKTIGGPDLTAKYIVKKTEPTAKAAQDAKLGPLFENQQDPETVAKEKAIKTGIYPYYTFDNYVAGKNNQLAYAIATAVADRPGEVYNPVFIYSGVGLGKTHLIHAIANKILKTKPGSKVVYTTTENFTNELVDSIKSGREKNKYTPSDFRTKYRKADVLLIDDIQFIATRDATQEELFNTFNDLYLAQKQIIITSDKPPKDFKHIEERLTSRFSSGIIVDIQPPDFETRSAILRKRRDLAGDNVDDSVIDYIAETVSSNIRELEGAYTRVVAKSFEHKPVLEEIAQMLEDSVRDRPKKIVNMNQILNAVCAYYAIKSSDVKGKRRTKEFVVPRQVAMYLIKTLTDTPFMSIGDFLGGRDHTTIMHGVEKIGNDVETSTRIKEDVTRVRALVVSG